MPRPNGITRQEILTTIKRNHSMTAEELHKALNISQVAVRQHLSSLEAEGIITVSIERRGLGRPSHRYTLTPEGDEMFPRHYDTLANALLDELRAAQGEEAVRALLAARRDRRQTAMQARLTGKPLSEQIQELARMQTENGYMAEVLSEEAGSCRLIQRNCAVYTVAQNHPDICCGSDLTLFCQLLDGVEISRDQFRLAGDSVCSFRFKAANKDSTE